MNKWKEIWTGRTNEFYETDDIFNNFIELKKANGFDVQCQDGYYESFYEQFIIMQNQINNMISEYNSVYEVGCGSGVNLYLLNKLVGIKKLGGIDYSPNLIEIAKGVIDSEDIKCGEALDISSSDKYDVVISDSVFQYFFSEQYGYEVLRKMYEKAEKLIIIKEIHDKSKEMEHLKHRRESIENYDALYEGLDKTFYDMQKFIEFADERGATYKIIKPNNNIYWNNKYVFDYYLIKG